MQTHEERLEEEIAEKTKYLKEYAEEKAELRKRLEDTAALINAPLSDEQPDVATFGRGAWVYCKQHMKAHEVGWCSVSVRDKIGLGVATAKEAQQKCRDWGFELYHDKYPNG
jgi:hypothetical protein